MSEPKAVWWLIGATTVVIGAVLIVVTAHYTEPKDFWGVALPAIMTGVGTLALATVTVVLAVQDRRRDDALRLEGRTRAQEEAAVAARRKQAEHVSAWLVRDRVEHRDGNGRAERIWFTNRVTAMVRNRSELPIWDVQTYWTVGGGEHQLLTDKATEPVLPPEQDVELRSIGYLVNPSSLSSVAVSFRDAAGLTWARYGDGRLGEGLPEASPAPYPRMAPGDTRLADGTMVRAGHSQVPDSSGDRQREQVNYDNRDEGIGRDDVAEESP